MQKTKIFVIIFIFFGLSVYVSTVQASPETPKIIPPQKTVPTEAPKYVVPEEKTTLWEDIQLNVEKVNEVCLEHCGTNDKCKIRCGRARDNNLQREYNKLMSN